jgi:hypothetical protein
MMALLKFGMPKTAGKNSSSRDIQPLQTVSLSVLTAKTSSAAVMMEPLKYGMRKQAKKDSCLRAMPVLLTALLLVLMEKVLPVRVETRP